MSAFNIVEKFEFDEKWLTTNFLNQELCDQLLSSWESSDDDNLEHYRYSVFRSILEVEELSFDTFLKYIDLCEMEFGTVLHCSPLIDLVKWKGLTPSQQEYLINKREKFPKPVEKEIIKHLSSP